MVKILKGKIVLSEKDMKKMVEEVNEKGKKIYVIYSGNSDKFDIDKEEFEHLIISGKQRSEIMEKYGLTAHKLLTYLRRNYGKDSIKCIRQDLTNTGL